MAEELHQVGVETGRTGAPSAEKREFGMPVTADTLLSNGEGRIFSGRDERLNMQSQPNL